MADFEEAPAGGGFGGPLFQGEHQAQAQEVCRFAQGFAGALHHCRQFLVDGTGVGLIAVPGGGEPRFEAVVDDGGDEGVFVLEVPVDGARGLAGSFTDQPDGSALVAAFGGDLSGGVKDFLA